MSAVPARLAGLGAHKRAPAEANPAASFSVFKRTNRWVYNYDQIGTPCDLQSLPVIPVDEPTDGGLTKASTVWGS